MKMLGKRRYKVKMKLTGADGEVMTFDSLQQMADFLNVTRAAVYQALRLKGKCRGCVVEYAESKGTNE